MDKVTKRLLKRFKGVQEELPKALVDSAAEWETTLKKRMRPFSKRNSASQKIRSGALRSSIRFKRKGKRLKTQVRMFSAGVPYAQIQEKGGVIRGRPFLSIPLSSTLGSTGFVKNEFRTKRSGGRWVTARGEPTFVFRSKKGNLIVATSKGGKLTPLRVLKKSVRLKPRLKFFETWDRLKVKRTKRLRAAVRKGMKVGA